FSSFVKKAWRQRLLEGWLGARPIRLGVPASLLPSPSPLPCARCSVVYISSPRRGACAPRDVILSLVLAPGALAGAETGLDKGCFWLPSLPQRTFPGIRAALPGKSVVFPGKVWSPLPCGPHGVMLCLYILYKGTCPFPL
uniref:Uncharacterized protein n=1 Tax=Ovis aries TaxID=9940 RepID=A0AC11EEE2_SHEEP